LPVNVKPQLWKPNIESPKDINLVARQNPRRRPKYLLVMLFEGVLAAFMREQNQANAQADFYDDDEDDEEEDDEEDEDELDSHEVSQGDEESRPESGERQHRAQHESADHHSKHEATASWDDAHDEGPPDLPSKSLDDIESSEGRATKGTVKTRSRK